LYARESVTDGETDRETDRESNKGCRALGVPPKE